ncbi:MFS transporter [Sphingomonas sp. DG1-23]|uniref:MFS transporter n=1 Tax=Sphingomonas sp. DG1-23 TaxID=3068316 RepID=UPI00273F2C26|nr:MFS transporter [Sphingomonas sp. DG1-23]MDP5280092.1 MFS transporter [Sphingomonas sp. DG1-23]
MSTAAAALAPSAVDPVSHRRTWVLLGTLLLIGIFSQIDRILPFILAETIRRDLGLSDTQLGLVTGLAFAVCYSLMSLPLARAADRNSPKIVMIVCILIWSTMTSLGGLAASFLFLAITRFGVALGEAGAIPSAHAIIARQIAPGRRGRAIGIVTMGIPLGTMMGFAGGGALGDAIGWRATLIGAGAAGGLIAFIAMITIRATPRLQCTPDNSEPFVRASLRLLSNPAFRWIFIGSLVVGFAGPPFYVFAASYLMRSYGLSASEVGLSFGLLQGLMGIVGTMVGGAGFDRAVRSGTGRVLGPPAILFLVASITTVPALLAPSAWLSIALLVPFMLSFSFLLPWAFGAAHLVAGKGKEAMASGLVLIGSGLLGPALGPVVIGMISDAVTEAGLSNGLGFGLMMAPAAGLVTGLVMLVANRRIAAWIGRQPEPVFS